MTDTAKKCITPTFLTRKQAEERGILLKRELEITVKALGGVEDGMGWSRREVREARSARRKFEAVLARFDAPGANDATPQGSRALTPKK